MQIESAFSLIFPKNSSSWGEDFAHIGAARAWLNANQTTLPPDYITDELKKQWIRSFGRKDAFKASLNCYRSLLRGVQAVDEASVNEEDLYIHVPVLSVGGLQDMVARADQLHQQFEPWASAGHTIKNLDTGHWMLFQDSEGVTKLLQDFFEA